VGPPLVSALSHFYNPLSAISLSGPLQPSTIPPWPSLPDAAWCCVAGRCVTKSIALNPPNEKSMITVAFQGKVPPPSSTEPPLTFSWVTSHPPPRARGVHPPRVPIFLMVLSMPYVSSVPIPLYKCPPPTDSQSRLPHHLFPISPFSAHIYCIAHTPTGLCPNGRRFFPPPEEYRPFWCPVFYYCCHYRSCCGFCFPVSGFQTLTIRQRPPLSSLSAASPPV